MDAKMAKTLDMLSRLKGIETRDGVLGGGVLVTLWICFPV